MDINWSHNTSKTNTFTQPYLATIKIFEVGSQVLTDTEIDFNEANNCGFTYTTLCVVIALYTCNEPHIRTHLTAITDTTVEQ